MPRSWVRKFSRVCAGLLVGLTFEALAQERNVVPPPEPLPPPRFLPREPRDTPFQLPSLAPAPPAELRREGMTVLVREILLEGNTVITTQELQKIAAPYFGRQLYPADIEELRRALTQYYVDRGYVNSGALLATETATGPGILSFRIIEGRVSRIQVRGLERLD